MYTVTRNDAALELNVSVRTIDRYVRLGKIRMKKEGKIIYLHKNDIDRMKHGGIQEEVTIVSKPRPAESDMTLRTLQEARYQSLYEEAKTQLAKKDETLKELAYQIGKLESRLQESIPIAEHKKTAYLLESSKTRIEEETKQLRTHIVSLERLASSDRVLNLALVFVMTLLLAALATVWFFTL